MIDTELVEALARTLAGSPVRELSISQEGLEVRFTRVPGSVAAVESAPADSPETAIPEPADQVVRSPRVGIYHKPQRRVHVGDRIEAGEVVGYIEAMRILNEVVAAASGAVTHVYVEDGSPVEYGEELFRLVDSAPESLS
ncbi:MAG: acetyl-CoA carboxylase biotin carboxyl carrier protein [Chloroflexi bacterium]|nr:acetyl-CoA carboxylase biotin carboxyl carrier protein [Chloroflexota bacterium]